MVQFEITIGASGMVTFIPVYAEPIIEIDSIRGGTPSTCNADVTLNSRPVPACLCKEEEEKKPQIMQTQS